MKRKREEAVGKAHERAEKEKERKAAEKRKQEKLALQEQMKVWRIEILLRWRSCIVIPLFLL